MRFSVGDLAVHPAHGIGEITEIEDKTVGSARVELYILHLSNSTAGVVKVATEAAERVGLRSVMSKAVAKRVLDELGNDEMAVTSQPWNRRFREYTEMLNSGSPLKVAQVMRDLAKIRAVKGELSYGERKLFEQARLLLVTEMAVARGVKEATIERMLDKAVEELAARTMAAE